MHRLLRAGILITFGMLIICIICGCGDDSPEEVTDPPQPAPATTVMVNPASGGYIPPNAEFVLTFDEGVVAVTVNGTPAIGSGLNWKWSAQPALPEGLVLVVVEWINRDGSRGTMEVGPYNVAWGEPEPPVITSGTVADGDADVDPAPINAFGFRFDFDEGVTGTIKLTDEAGADLNWIATVRGQTATLTAVAGQELAEQELISETTYKIEIDIDDAAGNRTQATITFVTKPK